MVNVAVLGATGVVGQRLLALLEGHPIFKVAEIAASLKNQGRLLKDTRKYRQENLSQNSLNMPLKDARDLKSPYILSCVSKEVASLFEYAYAENGQHVLTNASYHRMDPVVPLLIPEVNIKDLSLIEQQKTAGKIIANPNCVVSVLAPVLHVLQSFGTIKIVSAVTLQAISGAGFLGVSSLDILGNIIPDIEGEAQKIEREIRKILRYENLLNIETVRVPVQHGHTVCMHVYFENAVDKKALIEAFKAPLFSFHRDVQRPQPLVDLKIKEDILHIGSLKQSADLKCISLVALGHNLMRGAALAALKNLEVLHSYLTKDALCLH